MTHIMTERLARSRDIAWQLWDPIGLADSETSWRGSRAADEYDSYMRHVARLLRHGVSIADCVAYLVTIEAEHMGLGTREDTHARAERTVRAIGDL